MFKKPLYFFIIVILLYGLFGPLFVRADLTSDLQNEIDQKQSQIQELEKQIAQYKAAISSKKGEAATLNAQINKLENQIKYLQTQIKLTQTRISQTNLKIQGLASDIQTQEVAINKQKENLGTILRTIYEYDQESPFELVLKNDNFSDFLSQFQYIQNLQNNVQDKLNKIKELKRQLENQKTESEDQKAELENLKNQLRGQSSVLDNQVDEKADLLATTKNQEKKYQVIVSDLQKQRDQIEKEIFAAEEKLRLAINPNSLPGVHRGLFVWPAISKTYTQSYGCLINSFARKSYPACNEGAGGGGFHNGVDIDADIGDKIKAVMDGTVSGVGNLGKYSYGKWVTINHGNGLTTLYAHLSSQAIAVGQKVTAGQIVGYAGSTGYSTGAHLHFTVYATNTFKIEQKWYGPLPLGGSINPINYL